jgi:hypothetical protein
MLYRDRNLLKYDLYVTYVHHNLNDERGESPKSQHEKNYVMRFTKANGPVTRLVKIVKLITT